MDENDKNTNRFIEEIVTEEEALKTSEILRRLRK